MCNTQIKRQQQTKKNERKEGREQKTFHRQ